MTTSLSACEHLLLERNGSVLNVTLNRPQVRNALNARMWEEIEGTFAAIEHDRSVKIVVLRGAGGNFCAGGDISERSSLRESEVDGGDRVAMRNRRGGQIFTRIDSAPQVVVAVIEGFALGGGFGLACVADVAIAEKGARFGLPEVTLGLAPAQIVPFLLRRIGASEMRRIALTAERIDAAQALRIGIVHEVCEGAQAVDQALGRLLGQLDRGAPGAMAAAKRLIALAETTPQEALLDQASQILTGLARSPEGIEGSTAFKEKRRPHWQTPGSS
jgi:isohexenylglutaconyl-CoA hydratase